MLMVKLDFKIGCEAENLILDRKYGKSFDRSRTGLFTRQRQRGLIVNPLRFTLANIIYYVYVQMA